MMEGETTGDPIAVTQLLGAVVENRGAGTDPFANGEMGVEDGSTPIDWLIKWANSKTQSGFPGRSSWYRTRKAT